MFLDFYKLREQPFGVTPDPRFLFLGESHREALASLFCGIEGDRGFMVLIAQPGLGKTTLTFQLLEKLRQTALTAFLFQTQCNSRELLQYVLKDFGIDCSGDMDIVSMHNKLNEVLYKERLAGRRVILAIDEAQNLSSEALEAIRLLSNFEMPNAKLIQILLIGQPQLAAKLADPALSQLEQRIGMFVHLEPFNYDDTSRYVANRLKVAGHSGDAIFTPAALRMIAERSQGNPRNINRLCYGALSLGCAMDRRTIDAEIVAEAAADLHLERLDKRAGEPSVAEPKTTSEADDHSSILSYQKRPLNAVARLALAAVCVVAAIVFGIAVTSSSFESVSRLWRQKVWTETTNSSQTQSSVAERASAPIPASVAVGDMAEQSTATALSTPSTNHLQAVRVVVQPGETLRQISLRTLGRFSSKLVGQIQSINPGMSDPNHIESSQEIWLPVVSNSALVQPPNPKADIADGN